MTTHPRHRRPAFTIVELLVVIGIIVLLIGMLVPVVNRVRTASYAAKTQQTISRIGMAIDNYYSVFKAYPGPFSNDQLTRDPSVTKQPRINVNGTFRNLMNKPGNAGTINPDQITSSENLLVGLVGGVYYNRTGANAGTFEFDMDQVGKGPKNLSTLEGKQDFGKRYEPFFDLKPGDIYINPTDKNGDYADSGGDADDTIIPEFLDGFPNGMPILYLRANVGTSGVAYDAKNPPSGVTGPQQYELNQVLGYTDSPIGVGRPKSLRDKYTTPNDFATKPHGLRTANYQMSIQSPAPTGQTYAFPYDLHAYVRDPGAQFDSTAAASTSGAPRRKDTYILISPGVDRTYGTDDDITNFGSVK